MVNERRKLIMRGIQKFPGRPAGKIAKTMHRHGVTAAEVEAVRSGGAVVADGPPTKLETIAVDAVVQPHDLAGRALEIIGKLPAGHVIEDDVMRRTLAAGGDRWRRARGSARLNGHFTNTPDKRVVWGKPQTIARLAERLQELM